MNKGNIKSTARGAKQNPETVSKILDEIVEADDPVNVFLDGCNKIAKLAAQRTKSQMGILFLTADQKILEAVGRHGVILDQVLREDIPFYRLDWDVVPGYEYMYDGFTAWVAVHLRPGCYDVRVMRPVLENHPAHKGQWDPVVWRGEAQRYLDRILSMSIGKDYSDTEEYRCFGLLKVERELRKGQKLPFKEKEVQNLRKLSEEVREWFDNDKDRQAHFWQIQAQAMAGRKAAQFLTLFARGRSIGYNVVEGIGFITEFFRVLLGEKHAFHVFHGEVGSTQARNHAAVLPYWRPAYRLVHWKTSDDEKGMLASHTEGPKQRKVPPWREKSVRPRLLRTENLDRQRDSMEHYKLENQQEQYSPDFINKWNKLLRAIEAIWNSKPEKRGTVADVEAGDLNVEVPLPGSDPNKPAEWPMKNIKEAKLIRLLSSERDLGTIIIPTHKKSARRECKLSNEEIAGIASTLARTFGALLSSQYDITAHSEGSPRLTSVNLLSLRGIGSKWVAILFADIRGFSRLTQMLRLLGEKGALELLIDFYGLLMAEIISSWGRRDKFMGDGLMALYGEELGEEPEDNELKVMSAICSACEMVLVFEEIKSIWRNGDLNEQLLPWRPPRVEKKHRFDWTRIQREFAEEVDIESVRLAIGINFGNPYFDYFGDTGRREYTAVGDQVNLAKGLEEEANRRDDKLGRLRAPILLSQTVWSYAWNNGKGILLRPKPIEYPKTTLEWSPLRVKFPGIAVEYPAYEFNPSQLNIDRIKEKIRESEGDERARQLPFDLQANGQVTLSKERLKKIRRLSR